jgi:alpha-beta hydrolase superfamily lysophospholipase
VAVGGPPDATIGIAKTVFLNNEFMKKAFKNSLDFCLNTFAGSIMKNYHKSEMFFHKKPVKVPALILCSKADTMTPVSYSKKICDSYESLNIETTLKVFEDSSHVQHLQMYREEYLRLLMEHLRKCDLIEEGTSSSESSGA